MKNNDSGLRKTIRLVALLNLAYFAVEFTVAHFIGSVSLFADSIDFLEDASVNFLILLALGWDARRRAKTGMALAGILFIPGLFALGAAWQKFHLPIAPEPVSLTFAGAGAMAVNLFCALKLTRYRNHSGSMARAAFLSARNDVLANAAIVLAGLSTFYTRSAWPDLLVGLGIFIMNLGAAKEVYEAAQKEHRSAQP